MLQRKAYFAKSAIGGLLLLTVLIGGIWHMTGSAGGKKGKQAGRKYQSKVVNVRTKGHAVDIDVDITGAKRLFLVVTDGGNGYGCDWADWAEPRLIGPNGEKKLTDLKWRSAGSSWGKVSVNRNAGGRPLRINNKAVAYGIGTHANSVIAYDLPKGYTRFKARGGLDNGGTDQGGGGASSVQFAVYLDKLPKFAKTQIAGGSRDPKEALDSMDVGEGLEATLFAAEPMMLSPTNIDIDERGRVWVCEVVNYRRRNGQRKEGDRILILEDTNGDGKADTKKVFYQGRDIDSAMGICVLGNKVIVSVSPNIFIFTDNNGDDVPDSKEVFFTKTGVPQHDHSAHAFVFGPDGKLYWNFGNYGRSVHDKNGKPVVDLQGNRVVDNGRPYYGGMVFRCDMDGSNFETLGHNFRNNYEVTVDSFGTLWQSDNDDDGNRGVRINYVMEYGNYGYKDEINGSGWRSKRTGMHAEIPKRHWHLNDPGVVPNLLQTFAGSPTGICVNEGSLLPKQYRNEIMHCDAGPNVCRAYPAVKDGAGYKASILNILHAPRDKWYRPSDVCVAPDGSVFIADWYDPGVGGHGMGDTTRGRIFRIAPPKTGYKVAKQDYSTVKGAIAALKNPAYSVRYLAWTALNNMGAKAEGELVQMFANDDNPRFRARALWLLGKLPGKGDQYVQKALGDANEDIRIVGLRLARQLKTNLLKYVEKMVNDRSPQVRRECCIALREINSPKVPQLWAELAAKHRGKDRWYLEALGIAVKDRWDACFDAWLMKAGASWNTPGGRDIVWRSRAEKTPTYLAKIINADSTTVAQLPRLFRAFDFLTKNKDGVLLELAFGNASGSAERKSYIAAESITRLRNFNINNPKYKSSLNAVLNRSKGTKQFINLVEKFGISDRYPELLEMAWKNPTDQIGVDSITALLSKQRQMIAKALNNKDVKIAQATAQVLGTSADGRIYGLLMPFVKNKKKDLQVRRQAVQSLSRVRKGAQELVRLAKQKQLDPQLTQAAAVGLHQARWRDIKSAVVKLFPLPAGKNNAKLPSLAELLRSRGSVQRGQTVFMKAGYMCEVSQSQWPRQRGRPGSLGNR